VVLRNPAGPLDDANTVALSESYVAFEPIVGGNHPSVYVRMVVNGAHNFHIAVTTGQTYFIDPAIATVYSHATARAIRISPRFCSHPSSQPTTR
jgi:hypothetical protein